MSFVETLNGLYEHMEPLVSILDFMSMFIVLWGFIIGFLKFIYVEFIHPQGRFAQYEELRRSVGIYIILGLEFMIVSDLLNTIMKRDRESLIILGALVIIRTVISYFLGKEMKEAEDEAKQFQMGLRAVKFSAPEEVSTPKKGKK